MLLWAFRKLSLSPLQLSWSPLTSQNLLPRYKYISHLFSTSTTYKTTTSTTSTTTNTSNTTTCISRSTSKTNMPDLNSQYTIVVDDSQIEKPVIDDRSYRFIKLNSNDLKVLLIHDPQADKSAAALDVNVGSFADKQYGIPGLAHFCEHLLFMGTEKYPKENEYSNYLSKHSGHSNAYTSSEHTNYYFQVGSNHLEGALDRFAQFFISPLFSKTCKDREINAVDSENKKNLQNDDWRLYQLDKMFSNPDHPYNGFSTGNYQTLHVEPELRGVNVRDVLMQFHKDYYSSNLMSLVIMGKEDLDTLSKWAIKKFLPILNQSLSVPSYEGQLIYKQSHHLGKVIKAKPVKEMHQLELSFMVPDDLENKWASKPQSYFSHLLGHESEGSILYYLKHKGWVTELSSGNMKVSLGNSVYMVEFQLTPTGLKNWETIVATTFEYLALILKDDPKKWIWEEIRNISEINFKFKQKADASSTVSSMSNSLYKFDKYIPAENILCSSVVRDFDPLAIKKFGSYLNPDNFRITLVSQSFDNLTQKEPWYGTEYEIEDVPKNLKKIIDNPLPNKHLHYPEPNPFIPTNFNISKIKVQTPQTAPYLIHHDNKMNVWYKQDDQFEVPKGTIELVFHLPSSNVDVVSSTKSGVFTEMLSDQLNQITYFASLVGLRVGINTWRDGFAIFISGYNDKLPILLDQVLNKFIEFSPDKNRFEPIKFKLLKEYRNFGFMVPYNQIGSHHLQLVNEKVYDFEERIKALEQLQFQDVESFINKTIWSLGIFAEVLIHGNFDITTARKIKTSVSDHISRIPPLMEEYDPSKIYLQNFILQEGEAIRFEKELLDKNNINSCIEYYLQFSPNNDDPKLRVLTDLLATIIREPCFDQLRTKEQLGYVVFSGVKKGRTSLGFRILVQSERSSEYLEYRIEEFLAKFGSFVNLELSDKDFAKFKQALKDMKLQKLKHLNEETNRIWNSITDGYYDFDARQKHVDILENITKDDFTQFFNAYVGDKDYSRTGKLVVHLKSAKVNKPADAKLVQSAFINYAYKHGLKIEHEFIEQLATDSNSIPEAIEKFLAEIKKQRIEGENLNSEEAHKQIKEAIVNPVPAEYPKGKPVSSIKQFRLEHKLGGIPKPVCDLSKFSYEQSHL
ncbi:conserved hypothetical protein [Lodderomyces elongisporus NRRL YB-4239]|uniref:A-factor-processing enzyme n=1 Tax=Lodderomyces elongisporus (strain ATCC 11503 / CBS 2605 / JCM 1781 / NBRC 1676 / NRRL YB-4239) TaxID=379508 RepID=A5E5R4_LODEL|nr:conserved hypothetical protein [Lodderomyces elongisporus NRRL YB-4239]